MIAHVLAKDKGIRDMATAAQLQAQLQAQQQQQQQLLQAARAQAVHAAFGGSSFASRNFNPADARLAAAASALAPSTSGGGGDLWGQADGAECMDDFEALLNGNNAALLKPELWPGPSNPIRARCDRPTRSAWRS